ncbi:MAG: hypothetical protein GTO18_06215, partial [Anaerolineales bacterium]|nr:hypothetical protein [Anaerolineales bacterium]
LEQQDSGQPIPDFQGTVVDDLSGSFTRTGPGKYWHEETLGFNDHSWWTRNNQSGVENTARWTLLGLEPGTYEIFVFIPPTHATTRGANYTIQHGSETHQVIVDQSSHNGTWYSMGNFDFTGVGDEFIELIDETGEADGKFEIAFDAIGYLSEGSKIEEEIAGSLWLPIQEWLEEQGEVLEEKFYTWMEEQFKVWLDEQKGKVLRVLADALTAWIDEQCAGMGAAMLLPLFAFGTWWKRRRKK